MNHIKILLINDEAIILSGRKYSLEAACNYVKTALCGKKVSEVLEEGVPAIVLTDLIVPMISGVEVCRKIKARYLDIETVLVSGSHDEIRKHLLDILRKEDEDSANPLMLCEKIDECSDYCDKN